MGCNRVQFLVCTMGRLDEAVGFVVHFTTSVAAYGFHCMLDFMALASHLAKCLSQSHGNHIVLINMKHSLLVFT